MKRLLILAALFLAASCSKDEQFTTLTFGMRGIEEHSMTKASADDVRTLIAGKVPSTVDLTLTRSKTGKKYYVATGESITLPVGEYTVKGNVTPQSVTGFPREGMSAAATPTLSINETVTISSGVTSYSLTPSFGCFAIAALEDVTSFTYKHSSASGQVSGEGVKLMFFTWDNDYELTVVARPADYDSKDDNGYIFGGTGVQTRNGKFYIVHPEGVTTKEGGFTFNISSWTEGQL